MLEFGGSEADKLLDFLIFRLFFLEKIKFVAIIHHNCPCKSIDIRLRSFYLFIFVYFLITPDY